jgi:hypothetical protein
VGVLGDLEVGLAVKQFDVAGRGSKGDSQPRPSVQHYPGTIFQGYYASFLNTRLDQVLRSTIDRHTG